MVPGNDKSVYMQKLSSAFRMRVLMELTRLKRMRVSEELFLSRAKSAIYNIINCFQNKHSKCRQMSLVCCAHLAFYIPKFLPYGKHLELDATDVDKIKCQITKDFSESKLKEICSLKTTNKTESLHHRVFTYAPKCTLWSRNFTGLCHSAVHSATFWT